MDTCKGIEGKTIVFTGKISKPRYEFQELVKRHGGIAGSDVSGNTDYLVVGEKPGSKLARATMFGVKTISEQDFLNLLGPLEEEAPATSEDQMEAAYRYRTKIITINGFLDHPHLIILECSWCGKSYQQWDDLPNYETCPVCEMFYYPLCPHCKNVPLFVEDYNLYHCMLCSTWFKAPYSFHARKTKHLCYFVETRRTEEGVHKECRACGKPLFLSYKDNETDEELKEHYRMAPFIVQQWREEEKEREEARKKEEEKRRQEEEALKLLNSLTSQELAQLEEQLNANRAL